MENDEYVNCYCFNLSCNKSIFDTKVFSVIKMPLSKVLSEELCCPACGRELISKAILEIKMLVNSSRKEVETSVI
jgi:hypothetical protein